MSLLKHEFFPRSLFETHFGPKSKHLGPSPSSLDIFDPFDELDRMMAKNLKWINKPYLLKDITIPEQPKVPHKFRVSLDCKEYDTSSINIEVNKDHSRLIITGEKGQPKTSEEEDYHHRRFKRTFKIPPNAEVDKLASFLTSTGRLVVEIPIKGEYVKKGAKGKSAKMHTETFPRIIEDDKGVKTVQVIMNLPSHIEPGKIRVTCKDRDVIVQAEETEETQNEETSVHYYSRYSLPENTDFDSLKCVYDKEKLTITASVEEHHPEHQKRQIPVEVKGNSKKIKEN